jgi:polyisoprenoid-binding protein YceI
MKNLGLGLAAVVAVAIIVVVAFLANIWFSGGDAEPSRNVIEATICDAETRAGNADNLTLFCIVAEDSEAQFELEEDLLGMRNTVIGGTNEVSGAILIDFDNPENSQLGIIRINARTLVTDDEFRNRSLRAEILLSSQDEFEFIDFEATALNGLPDSIEVGGSYDFDIVGNLSIIGMSNEVTFSATVTIDSDTQISGTASTTVLRSDYDIGIPDAPGVANVENEVDLTINFEAVIKEAQ